MIIEILNPVELLYTKIINELITDLRYGQVAKLLEDYKELNLFCYITDLITPTVVVGIKE